MKTLFHEIYFASSEKCILSGCAGFGVRTYSNGLTADEVNQIARDCRLTYSIATEKMVTRAQIEANPDCVADFPPVYFYRELTLTNGKKFYCVGRIVYVGIDYGYFACIDSATRAGSNYLAHVAVSYEPLDFTAISRLISSDFFKPRCLSAHRDNAEYKALLTGEPTLLEPREVDAEALSSDYSKINGISGEAKGAIVAALLQRRANIQSQQDSKLTKLIIVAKKAEMAGVIAFIGSLPKELTAGLTFQSHYCDGYGVPEDLCCVIVDEDNTVQLYTNLYLNVDLIGHKTENIPAENYFLKKIRELYVGGEDPLAAKVTAYYMSLDLSRGGDYEFLYKLYISTLDEGELSLVDITPDFYKKVDAANISRERSQLLFSKVNEAINSALLSTSGNTIREALHALVATYERHASDLRIKDNVASRLTQMLFGSTSYLHLLADGQNIKVLLGVSRREEIDNESNLFNALLSSSDATVWREILKFYYGTQLNYHHDRVVATVMRSKLDKNSIDSMLQELYPLDQCKELWRQFFLNHQAEAVKLPSVLAEVCNAFMPDFAIKMIVSSDGNAQTINALVNPVHKYLAEAFHRDADATCQMLMKIANSVGVDAAEALRLTDPLGVYVDRLYDSSAISDTTRRMVSELLCSRIVDSDRHLKARLETINSIANGETLERVDTRTLLLAARLRDTSDYYLCKAFAAWLSAEQPSTNDVAKTIKSSQRLSGQLMAQLIDEVWFCKTKKIHQDRGNYIDKLIDNSSLSSRQWSDIASRCKAKDLAEHINNSNGWLKRIMRKILNKFF